MVLDPLLQHLAGVEGRGVPHLPVVGGRGALLQPHEVVHVLVADLSRNKYFLCNIMLAIYL